MPHDRNGNILNIGDAVLLPARVTHITPNDTACNVTIEATQPDDDANEYKPQVTCNARSVLLSPSAVEDIVGAAALRAALDKALAEEELATHEVEKAREQRDAAQAQLAEISCEAIEFNAGLALYREGKPLPDAASPAARLGHSLLNTEHVFDAEPQPPIDNEHVAPGAEQFAVGGTTAKTKGLPFGTAIEAAKAGARIAREGWNGKGMFVTLKKGAVDDSLAPLKGKVDGVDVNLFDRHDPGVATRLPHLAMRTATGSTLNGWLASQTDILAEDWTILD